MRYGLIPKGPARRAVVFGGSNVHIFKPTSASTAASTATRRKALIASATGPEWSIKLAWVGSNPATCAASRPSG